MTALIADKSLVALDRRICFLSNKNVIGHIWDQFWHPQADQTQDINRLGWIFADVIVVVWATDVSQANSFSIMKFFLHCSNELAYVTSSLCFETLMSVNIRPLLYGYWSNPLGWHEEVASSRLSFSKRNSALLYQRHEVSSSPSSQILFRTNRTQTLSNDATLPPTSCRALRTLYL